MAFTAKRDLEIFDVVSMHVVCIAITCTRVWINLIKLKPILLEVAKECTLMPKLGLLIRNRGSEEAKRSQLVAMRFEIEQLLSSKLQFHGKFQSATN